MSVLFCLKRGPTRPYILTTYKAKRLSSFMKEVIFKLLLEKEQEMIRPKSLSFACMNSAVCVLWGKNKRMFGGKQGQ